MKIKNLTDKTLEIGIGCINADFPFYTYELKPNGSKQHGATLELDKKLHLDFFDQLIIREKEE